MTLNLKDYDIQELKEDYELEITKKENGYEVKYCGQTVDSLERLENFMDWYEIADEFHTFDDEIEDYNNMTAREEEYYEMLKSSMEEAACKCFN